MNRALFVDASALVYRYARGIYTDTVARAMAATDSWVVSAMSGPEVLAALHRVALDPRQHDAMAASARADLDRFHSVPVDGRCLADATDIAERYRVAVPDAVQLAAATRLGSGTAFLTLSVNQVPAAEHLGLDVLVRPREPGRSTRSATA